jgi:hypothetical protein
MTWQVTGASGVEAQRQTVLMAADLIAGFLTDTRKIGGGTGGVYLMERG